MSRIGLVCVLSLLVAACSRDPSELLEPESPDKAVTSDLGAILASHGIDPVTTCTVPPVPPSDSVNFVSRRYYRVGGVPQRLDLAWPKTPGPHPLVVAFHGGHWYGGRRGDLRSVILRLAGAGYAAAAPDYRLAAAPNNVFPAAVEDVRCAIRWLRRNGATYGIDPARVAAYGFGAGGHLASLVGTAADVPGLDGSCPHTAYSPAVKAVVSLAGTHDLRDPALMSAELRSDVTNFLGADPLAVPALAAKASPIVHVGAPDPPFLLIQRTKDPLNPVVQSRNMRNALEAAGVAATLIELRGEGHSFNPFGTGSATLVSACTILAFLEQELQP